MTKRKTVGNYILQKELGRGNFGVVFYAVKLDRKEWEPKEYAVKRINRNVKFILFILIVNIR